MKKKHIFIGCGTAALSALKHMRNVGCDDPVTLVSMESEWPYSPMSLPYLLANKVKAPDIAMVPEDFFGRMGATLVRDKRVASVSTVDREVLFADGSREPYDSLLVASGSEPVIPEVLRQAGCTGFHVMEDCRALAHDLGNGRKVTVLGGGLVGMEMAPILKERGHDVDVIAPRERVLRSYFDIETSGRIIELFADSGVPVHLNWGSAVEAKRSQNGTQLGFESQETTHADVVLACMGVTPRVSFLSGSGVDIAAGVVVDDEMRTNVPNVYAAGDVAEARSFLSGKRGLNPTLPNAVSQGKIVGAGIGGKPTPYGGWLPMNTFNFFGHVATSIGKTEPSEGEEVLSTADHQRRSFRRLICRGGTLVGASFINCDVNTGVIQQLITRKIDVAQHKGSLLEAPRETALWLMREAERADSLAKEE